MKVKKADLLENEIRNNYPYGMWLLYSGKKVLFNRNYEPLPDKAEWLLDIDKTDEVHFYDDSSAPWQSVRKYMIYQDILKDYGIALSFNIIE